jgi:hypothetical protein
MSEAICGVQAIIISNTAAKRLNNLFGYITNIFFFCKKPNYVKLSPNTLSHCFQNKIQSKDIEFIS